MNAFERPAILVCAMVYLAVVCAIGWWAARRTRTARDFFIAGQGVGLLVTALATMSAAFSGFLFVGGPGLTYRLGMASFFICFPVSVTAGLLCWAVARRLRLLAAAREIYTIPDALGARFGSRRVAGWAALAVVVGSVGYLGAQLQALGIVLDQMFGLSQRLGDAGPLLAVLAGVAIVLVYATAGGMMAGVYTDVFQGLLMMVAALGVFVVAWRVAGGPAAMLASIAGSERFGAAFLDPLGASPWTAVCFFFVFAVGILGQPHSLHKFYMLDDPRKLRWMPLVLAASQTLVILLWLGVGLAVPALVAQGRMAPLASADQASMAFLLGFVPEALAGLVFAGVLAAIMSTADSFVNIASAALVRDLPRALGRPLPDELRSGRRAVVAIALAATLLAWFYGDLVALLGTFAYGTFAAALAPALAIGLNWPGCTARAAEASVLTGLVLNLGLELLGRAGWQVLPAGVLPSAVALGGSFVVLVVVSALRRRDEPLDEDVRIVMSA